MDRIIIKRKTKENIYGYAFIAPVLLGIAFFAVTPFVLSFVYSFTNFNGLFRMDFVKFDNYVKLFSDDDFLNSLKVTFGYAIISVLLSLVLSFFLAVLLNAKLRGIKVFRVILYAPVIIPAVASAAIWRNIFAPSHAGVLNQLITALGMQPFPFFNSEDTALFSMILMSLWGLGGNMLIWIAGFNGISASYYEAAELDGANRFQKLFFITIPMVTPVIFYNLVTGVIAALQSFGPAYLITDGGPNNATNFLTLNIYHLGISRGQMGYACAQAWVLFAIILILTLILFKTSSWVFYSDEGGRNGKVKKRKA